MHKVGLQDLDLTVHFIAHQPLRNWACVVSYRQSYVKCSRSIAMSLQVNKGNLAKYIPNKNIYRLIYIIEALRFTSQYIRKPIIYTNFVSRNFEYIFVCSCLTLTNMYLDSIGLQNNINAYIKLVFFTGASKCYNSLR